MESILLTVNIILAILLVIVILLQRSEGGALGLGVSQDSFTSSRSAGDFLTKFTSILAVFFIITNRIGKKGYMSWSHIKEMSNLGFEIGSHCVTHPRLDRINHDDAYEELVRSKHIIENQILDVECVHACVSKQEYENILSTWKVIKITVKNVQ